MICLTCCIAKWGEFPEFPHLGKLSFKAVENFIKEQNKQLSPVPLRLEIYSPDVVDLRLVDLPGLIHVRRVVFILRPIQKFILFQESYKRSTRRYEGTHQRIMQQIYR